MVKLLILFVFALSAEANIWDDIKDYFNQYFGGEKTEQMTLPEYMPQESSAKDISQYQKKRRSLTEFEKLDPTERSSFEIAFLKELYQVVANVEPLESQINQYLNVLLQGGTREGVYHAIVSGESYFELEGFDVSPKDKLIKAIDRLGSAFYYYDYDESKISKLNFYLLKKEVVNQMLDVLSSFEKNNLDDLDRWYALYSSYLASRFGRTMDNDLRKNDSVDLHYRWSQNSPVDHIKSEAIMKTHLVLNSIQEI